MHDPPPAPSSPLSSQPTDYDPLWSIRSDVGSAAGLVAAVALWALLGLLGHTHPALVARTLVELAAAASVVLIWRRLDQPGATLCWTMGTFIAFSLVGAVDAVRQARGWW